MTARVAAARRQEEGSEDAGTAREEIALAGEGEFICELETERSSRARQEREERKAYALRIFILAEIWLAVVAAILLLQGFLGPHDWFHLSDGVLIVTTIATSASVTALLVVAVRYLFPHS